MMDCRDFEDLLPLYNEGELDHGDRTRVEAHVQQCPECREALAFYAELESALIERRTLRPPAGRTAAGVIARLGLTPRRSVFGSLVGMPGIVSAALIVIGVVLLAVKDAVFEASDLLVRAGGAAERIGDGFTYGLSPKVASWAREISHLSGTGEWTLICACIGLVALAMLVGSWMVLRFVRR
ncbi:MAG: zf-HC2 domain-containing protein [bacterium]